MARIILKLLANLLVTWTIAVGFSALFNGQHLQPVVLKNVICDNCEFVLPGPALSTRLTALRAKGTGNGFIGVPFEATG